VRVVIVIASAGLHAALPLQVVNSHLCHIIICCGHQST